LRLRGRSTAKAEPFSKLAERTLAELNQKSRRAAGPGRAERLLRKLELARQWLVRKLCALFQEHWDIGVFDVAFGCVKAFGVYPALYFAGLAWTIPVMEYAPLNTQLWTAGYLFSRRQILSQIGRRRYGHSLNRLDELRDRALGIRPRDARSIHRFELDEGERCIRVRRSRFRSWLERRLGRAPEPNVLLQSELRAMLSDREFLFQANPLRSNPYFFEEVLLKKILSTPQDRAALLARLLPEAPLEGEARELLAAIGETQAPLRARSIAHGESVTAALRERLGAGFSISALALRWISWSHQRRIYRELTRLESLEYRLLADLLEGETVQGSGQLAPIRQQREEIERWLERAARFVERVRQLSSEEQAQRLLENAIEEGRAIGLTLRLARAARWLSRSTASSAGREARTPAWSSDR
jgi:hypothetical protein